MQLLFAAQAKRALECLFLYVLMCSWTSPPPALPALGPSLCEIVQCSWHKGKSSLTQANIGAHKPQESLITIGRSTEFAQPLSLLRHAHRPLLREDITLLPFVKWVLSDVTWARCVAEYRAAELGRAACVPLPLLSVGFYVPARSCLHCAALHSPSFFIQLLQRKCRHACWSPL